MEIKRARNLRETHIHIRLTDDEKRMLRTTMDAADATATEIIVAGIKAVHSTIAKK